jgi:hypothetical protein
LSLSLKVTFVKKVGTKNEDWFYELKSSSRKLSDNFLLVMKKLKQVYEPMKKSEKGFRKYKHIGVYFKGKKIDTLLLKRETKENLITIDYLLKLNWDELSQQDIYKIITINFPSILWNVKDATKRLIRNHAQDNPLELSNGQDIIRFNFKTETVTVYSDPLYIKKSKYKTPVRYRGQ